MKKEEKQKRKLTDEIKEIFESRSVTILLLILIGIFIYLLYAYYPLLNFKYKGEDLTKETIEWETDLADEFGLDESNLKAIPEENMLVIPRIGVKTRIWEGDSLNILNNHEGVWREPSSSSPTRGSNMVIAGHRRQFLPPNTNTFYLLPNLRVNDYIIVYWEGEEYKYVVTQSHETDRTDPEVYEKTSNTAITLYTCSPLATAARRWVIRAERFI